MNNSNFTEAYQFLVAIFGASPFGIIALDMRGEISIINQQARVLLDLLEQTNKLIDKDLLPYLSHLPSIKETLNDLIREGRKAIEIAELQNNDKYLRINFQPILNGQLIIIEDITNIKLAEFEATKALLAGQELERQRLAKEVHDGLGPLLSTINLHLDSLKEKAPDELNLQFNKVIEMTNNVAQDVRSISHALMPSSVRDFGLSIAIQNLCHRINESDKIQVFYSENEPIERLEQDIELSLYRIAQELLNNALKYAQAKHIQVQLTQEENQLSLVVEDDGVGFDLIDGQYFDGIGLQNIETRAKSMGGVFKINTAIGKGVEAVVELPWSV